MESGCGEQEAGVASGSGWNLWVLPYARTASFRTHVFSSR